MFVRLQGSHLNCFLFTFIVLKMILWFLMVFMGEAVALRLP